MLRLGLLQPLPIPEQLEGHLYGFNHGTTLVGFNTILTVVDRLSKERHYTPCTGKQEPRPKKQLIFLGLSLLMAYPGLYLVCVSCGNPCALGWKSSKLSTAYHPQGTGYKMGTLPAELVTMQDDWSTLRIMMEKREHSA